MNNNKLETQTIKQNKSRKNKKILLGNGAKSEHITPSDFKKESKIQQTVCLQLSHSQNSINSTTSAMVCRICLDYDNGVVDCSDTNFNPMISPCGCSGTMGGIHLKCLREWIERNKIMKAVKGHVVIKYKKINCELCKQKYPFSISINNKIVDIINIERPKDNFIILETLSSGV